MLFWAAQLVQPGHALPGGQVLGRGHQLSSCDCQLAAHQLAVQPGAALLCICVLSCLCSLDFGALASQAQLRNHPAVQTDKG